MRDEYFNQYTGSNRHSLRTEEDRKLCSLRVRRYRWRSLGYLQVEPLKRLNRPDERISLVRNWELLGQEKINIQSYGKGGLREVTILIIFYNQLDD